MPPRPLRKAKPDSKLTKKQALKRVSDLCILYNNWRDRAEAAERRVKFLEEKLKSGGLK